MSPVSPPKDPAQAPKRTNGKGVVLSEKQRRFVEAYLGEAAGNGTLAARLAGYTGSAGRMAVAAHTNLQLPVVQEAIAKRVEADPLVATRKERQQFWSKVMRGEEGSRPQTTAGGVVLDARGDPITLPPEMKDRLKASELLGKTQADFVERHEHSGPNGAPLAVPQAPLLDLTLLTTDELRLYRELTIKATPA